MERVRRTLVAVVTALLVVAVSATADAAPGGANRDALQRALDDLRSISAVGVLVEVRDEDGVWRSTSGYAEVGAKGQVPVNGLFRIGSITKTFLAAVVLQLVGEGRLRLDDPVDEWLPGAVPDARITVRQLLDHTSGLPEVRDTLPMPPGQDFVDNRMRTWTSTELVERALARPPEFEPPGSRFSYSNTGYLLLGQIVEEVTGRSYGEEIERRIIQPLRLRDTSVPGTSPRLPGPHPHGYVPMVRGRETYLLDYTEMNPSFMGAGGEMISTTADLNLFFDALLGGRVLSDHLLDEMRTPGRPGHQYGLALRWHHLPCGTTVYGNDGDALTHQSWSFTSEDRRRQVTVALTPDFSGDPDDTVDAFLDKVFCD